MQPPRDGPPDEIPPGLRWDPNSKKLVPTVDPDLDRKSSGVKATALAKKKDVVKGRTAYQEGIARREKVIEALAAGKSLTEAIAEGGVVLGTYKRWRIRFPQFAARVDAARVDARDREQLKPMYKGDFAAFRKRYLGNDSTWFQLRAVHALDSAKPGTITLMLWPPEHGKTTTIEDFCNYKLGDDPTTRITVVSERQDHSKKILRRVRTRMTPGGPAPEYVMKFGPFVPQPEDLRRGVRQPWTDIYFDVWRRGAFDERDYSMQAVGINTGIAGTRTDWLILDDIQSLKSLQQTPQILDTLRQDFFSRPGIFGRIAILSTRVGELDVYHYLIEEGLVDEVIIFPAHDHEGKWLWPERYTEDDYERLRKRVGEQAWWRNYMQRPSAVAQAAFNQEMIEACKNTTRSMLVPCPKDPANPAGVVPVTITIDPALGGKNVTMALGEHKNRLLYLSSRVDEGLTRTEQIFDILEQTIIRHNEPGVSRVHEIVVEAMAFQRGLLDDDRMREIITRYDVRVVPHMTGANKYDPNLGIAAMALSFLRHEVDLPYSDTLSQAEIQAFERELIAWRPYKRGTRLVQDRVMAWWFGWLRWRDRRRGQTSSSGSQQSFTSDRKSPVRRAS